MKREQVVFILGGGILEDDGVWRTTNFTEAGDAFGALGDRLRVEAAAILYKANPGNTLLVPSGSKGQLKDHPTAPTVATVIAGELQELGVPIEAILLDEASSNSYQQLCTLKQMAVANNWQDIRVLTNQWHIMRVDTMVGITDFLKSFFEEKSVTFIAAEAVLLEVGNTKWKKLIDDAYASDGMRKREEKEAQGIYDLLAGTYILQ
ncbi:MAG: YdcF family protein [Patescibacteria group bacterium]